MERRRFIAGLAAAPLALALPTTAFAITQSSARALIDKLIGEINTVIASGKSESAMIADFEKILARYGDMSTIAQSTLGPQGRSASASDKRAFQTALQGYIARKYGKRFREFIGGRIEVQGVKKVNRYFEVNSLSILKGQSPFALDFLVSDRSGKDLFFDMKIEGVSLLLTERREVGALLDRHRGNVKALTADLKKRG